MTRFYFLMSLPFFTDLLVRLFFIYNRNSFHYIYFNLFYCLLRVMARSFFISVLQYGMSERHAELITVLHCGCVRVRWVSIYPRVLHGGLWGGFIRTFISVTLGIHGAARLSEHSFEPRNFWAAIFVNSGSYFYTYAFIRICFSLNDISYTSKTWRGYTSSSPSLSANPPSRRETNLVEQQSQSLVQL